ncbi:MAG: site-specific integrase [Euryarchaeota archaeon]|nr:site-specific integrase [Euryarchaeota archaeon]
MERNHANTPAEAERRIPDLVARLSDPNRTHVEEYLTLKVAQGTRSSTREHYARALHQLDAALNGKPWATIDHIDVARFVAAQRLAGYSDDTLRSGGSYIKAFLRWHRDEGKLPPRLVAAFYIRNRGLPERPIVTDEEEKALLATAPTLRDQVIVSLLLEAGFRVSELRLLDVGHVQLDDRGGAWITMPPPQEGLKTGPRPVYVAKSRGLLESYLSLHPNRGDPAAPLLLAYDNRRLARPGVRLLSNGIRCVIHRVQRRAGVRPFRPHDARHTSITRASDAGLNLVDLSERYWGRRDSRHAARYIHHSQDHKERVARQAAGIDPNGSPVAPRDETEAKLLELRRLWRDLIGGELPRATPRDSVGH